MNWFRSPGRRGSADEREGSFNDGEAVPLLHIGFSTPLVQSPPEAYNWPVQTKATSHAAVMPTDSDRRSGTLFPMAARKLRKTGRSDAPGLPEQRPWASARRAHARHREPRPPPQEHPTTTLRQREVKALLVRPSSRARSCTVQTLYCSESSHRQRPAADQQKSH